MTSYTSALSSVLERTAHATDRTVFKRDGRVVPWDNQRVVRAVALAFHDVRTNTTVNPHQDSPLNMYGLELADWSKVLAIANRVEQVITAKYYMQSHQPTIEQIQDVVELTLMAEGEFEVARSYVKYRAFRNRERLVRYDPAVVSDYVITAKYMRYLEDKKRRETLDEATDRVLGMHLRRFNLLEDNLTEELVALKQKVTWAFDKVRKKEVWPSSRSMQFGGRPIELHEAKMYNCCYSPVTRVEFFREYLYLLLCGCGCGFSVQRHHVNQLPEFPVRGNEYDLPVIHFEIPDTIQGWADAVNQLFLSYLFNFYVEFSYAKIRKRGAPLRTSGGKAPGHLSLKNALKKVAKILDGASGRRLKPIEVYDINMHLARAVLSGGIRRSATICLFSPDDVEMMTAKIPQNFNSKSGINPQRSASNNSAVLIRSEADRATYDKLFQTMLEMGEPGFFFAENSEHGTNPCVEIGLYPVVDVDSSNIEKLQEIITKYEADFGPFTHNGTPIGELEHGDRIYGWQFCNLTTINGAKCLTPGDFYESCEAAALIGTLQADYTHIPYCGPFTQHINEREALLGVSICGVMDNPHVLLDPAVLERGAQIVMDTNHKIADTIGINYAARNCCIKPEGTASLALGAIGSGIHPHPAHRYFRRIQANRVEPVLNHFKKVNPQMVEPSIYNPHLDDVICFPVEAPDTALTEADLNGIQFLDCVNLVMRHWVIPGTYTDEHSPGLRHNVSNTVSFSHDDKRAVQEWIWSHRTEVTGISLLMDAGVYPQAPREPVESEQQIAKWNTMNCRSVDYTTLNEEEDNTSLKETVACAGGMCDVTLHV